jgi:ABC-2 type transport system permease protein
MEKFKFLIKREIQKLFSNSIVVAIFFGAPVLYAVLFGFVYQKATPDQLPIVVVDLDDTPLSAKIIDMLDDNNTVSVKEVKRSKIGLHQSVIDNSYDAVVIIPDRFEADIIQKRHPEIEVDINTANILTANYSAKGVQYVMATLQAGINVETLKKQGAPAQNAMKLFEPFKVNYSRFFNDSANYMAFLWPGMLATIWQQVFLLVFALSFAREFEEKTMGSEFMKYSTSPAYAIFIKIIPFWILGIPIWLFLTFLFPAFKVPILHIEFVPMFLLGLLFTISVTFLGLLFSIALPSQLKATEFLMVLATPSFVLSGFTWPLSEMPVWIQYFANIIPLTHFLEGFRKLSMYSATFSDITPQLVNLVISSIIFALMGYFLLRYKMRKIASQELDK